MSQAVKSVLHQSLHVSTLTFLHGCRGEEDIVSLEESVRDIVVEHVGDQIFETDTRFGAKFLRFVSCTATNGTADMEHCVLRYLARKDELSKGNSFVAVSHTSAILEPTALEKLWLYMFVRPNIHAVRALSYDQDSLKAAVLSSDPMNVNVSYPPTDPSGSGPVTTLPLMFKEGTYKVEGGNSIGKDIREYWDALAAVMRDARLLRQALYTDLDYSKITPSSERLLASSPGRMLSLHSKSFEEDDLPAHLWSDTAFYKYSARVEEEEVYANPLDSDDLKSGFDMWGMPFRSIAKKDDKPHVFFLMPWIQMGGSEKCVLDIAERMVKMDWSITFVLTMPFWAEDAVGEMSLQHEWLNKAYALSSDVFDIVELGPNDKFTKMLRYLIETRSPDYVFTGNSRVIYEHTKFIKELSPKTVIADYNHMVHMDWEVVPGKGGGMPRYGTSFTDHIDLHLTASDNVTKSMKTWMDPDTLSAHPEKVKTCYIGTDPDQLHSDDNKAAVRAQMRNEMGIASDQIVVLFAGRFVKDKGIDVMGEVVSRVAEDSTMASKLTFVFVGSGEEKDILVNTQKNLDGKTPKVILRAPAVGIEELRDYYAMGDIFLLPSNNEGIALVLYEAMAAGMLVMSTDVGGQKELIRTNTGVLLPNIDTDGGLTSFIVRQLQAITKFTPMFKDIQRAGTLEARQRFTTEKFCDCVINNMERTRDALMKSKPPASDPKKVDDMQLETAEIMRAERIHGQWNRKQKERSMEGMVTIGIKTYVCDQSIVRQVVGLVRSIRVNYPRVRVLLANDGPTLLSEEPLIRDDPHTEEVALPSDSGISVGRNVMVNMTTTKHFVLLDDDHVFDEDTDLHIAVNGLNAANFDIVGIRVRNLPGIEELERISIFIPRYVAKVSKFENREVTLCVWNENNGPGVQSMRVPIRVDVLHNALIAKTDVLRVHPWRNILKVNEHMTFFLDARKAGLRVGYLPSVFVHHRARRYSACYKTVRFREEKYERLLEYKDDYNWDVECGDKFPHSVAKHLEDTKHLA